MFIKKNRLSKIFHIFLCVFLFFFADALYANQKKIIILDPGHDTTKDVGTIGAHGLFESYYNDLYVSNIVDVLKNNPNYQVIVTRAHGQTFSKNTIKSADFDFCDYEPSNKYKHLKTQIRSCIANSEDGEVFISIHFDSPPKEYISIKKHEGKVYATLTEKFFNENLKSGFAVFIPAQSNVSQKKFSESLKLASIISNNMQTDLMRTPSNFHQKITVNHKTNMQRGYQVIDEKNGIFSARKLHVLKKTKMPSILIEVGVISDPNELKTLNTKTFQENFGLMIEKSLNEFFKI